MGDMHQQHAGIRTKVQSMRSSTKYEENELVQGRRKKSGKSNLKLTEFTVTKLISYYMAICFP